MIFGPQLMEPSANALSKAASVSACLPNSNQCLYLARLQYIRHTPRASRAIRASIFVAIVSIHIKTMLGWGSIISHSMRPIPVPALSISPIFPACATQSICAGCGGRGQQTGCIVSSVRALFLANFRFAGILLHPYSIYPFLGLRVLFGREMAFFGGRPLFLADCAFLVLPRAIFGAFCAIFDGSCAQSTKFCTIPPRKWSHCVHSFEPTLRPVIYGQLGVTMVKILRIKSDRGFLPATHFFAH